LVSCRGTFGSGGTFDAWRNEAQDGVGVVEWMRTQEWYTGSFATMGGSYLGFVQWALLQDPPEDMVAAVIQCSPHDFSQHLWGTGSLALEFVTWGETMVHQEGTGFLATLKSMNTPRRMRPVLDRVPLAEGVKEYLAGSAPWLDFVVDHPDTSDPYYEQMKCGQALERAKIPIFLVGGWYDVFARQTMEQYTRLSAHNPNIALLMGPWHHMQVGLQSSINWKSFSWMEEHLAKRPPRAKDAAVKYFTTGAETWRSVDKWPPPTHAKELHLHPNNLLADTKSSTPHHSSFTLDPNAPTPTTGGNLLLGGGSADDTSLSHRADVLIFITEPLPSDLEIAGPIVVELSHSSDDPHVDLSVRLSEVSAKGRSRGITNAYQRLDVQRSESIVTLSLYERAHVFRKGNRIRLIIAGASHPQFAINEGVGVDEVSGKLRCVTHTIAYGGDCVSRVVLPV
ncbi:alpha/beta-hydrolase, partial [Dothidotthia symphoricarpi CBS 119687]